MRTLAHARGASTASDAQASKLSRMLEAAVFPRPQSFRTSTQKALSHC